MHVLVDLDTMSVLRYPYSIADLRFTFPDVSWPAEITDERAQDFGCFRVAESERPACLPMVQVLEELAPLLIDGSWVQQWNVRTASGDEIAAEQQVLFAQYEARLDDHLDEVAQQKRYTNRFTCALRAGYPGPYHDECAKFAAWMDSCNALAYQMMTAIVAGTAQIPESPAAFIAALPTLEW